MQRGDLSGAAEDANRAFSEFGGRHPDWAWRFRVLKAEILLWRGFASDSLVALKPEPSTGMETDESAVRRRIVQGLANCFLQQFDAGSRHLEAAAQLSNTAHPELLSEVYLAQGTLRFLRGSYADATVFFSHALQIARQRHQPFVEANALGSLGIANMQMGRLAEALDFFTSSLQVSHQLGSRTQISKTLGNMGWIYFKLGDLDKAFALSTEASEDAAKLGLAKDELIWLTNIGTIEYNQQQYKPAEQNLQRALAIAKRLQNGQAAAVCLNNLTMVALEQRQYEAAEEYSRDALALRASNNRPSELYSIFNSARIAAGRGDTRGSIAPLREVVRDSAADVWLRWEAEAELAQLYAGNHQPQLSALRFQNALATVDTARASLNREEYRLSFLTTAADFYNEYIDFLVSRGRVREALAVAEHSRARTLAEGLGLTTKNSQHLYPATEAQAQAVARQDNAVILYYWLKPERSYLWAITPQKLALFSLRGQDEIDAAVQAWRKALVGPRDPLAASNPAGQKLYEMLVAPAQKLIPAGSRMVIVADGSLHGLNFETLLAPGSRPHYWIEDVEISNANSLELLAASQRKRRASGGGLLLIGDPLTAGTEFPPLARAEDEVQRVEDHFDGNQRVTFTRDQATATAYRDSQPGRFAYIHFVAHGTSSRISPLDSAVVLSKEGDSYKLYARDIVQQSLHANLVTISACYGAGERAYTGEGLVGLSWAFLRAGAHNVIGALWEVNDISTPQLMDTMYTDLQKGRDPAAALRAAKLAMLHSDSVFRRPFYWAPFQLYVGS